MSRPLPTLAAGVLVAAGLAAGCARTPEAENLVLVTIDTLRADHVGIYGGRVSTPHLDALARRGVALEQAYTPTPTTAPAHASLFTGLHPWRHGVLDNGVPLQAGIPTLASLLRGAGLDTAAFVASYVLDERFGFARGFDHYEFVSDRGARWRGEPRRRFYGFGEHVAERAAAWIDERPVGQRFALWVHFFDPHAPYEPPERFALPPDHPVSLDGKTTPPGVDGPDGLIEAIRDYRGEVRRVDAQIGKLVASLDEAGLRARTAIVVTADHGEGLGDHQLLEHGRNLFEELVRVPLIVNGPGIPARGLVHGLAQLEDLLPTALGLLDVPAPADLDGVDLGPALRGEVDTWPRDAVAGQRKTYAGKPALHYLHEDGKKWIGVPESGGQVFYLADDPRERHGLRAVTPPALAELLAESVPAGRPDLDEESRRGLEALGYLDSSRDAP